MDSFALNSGIEEEIDVLDEQNSYFIGRTSQYRNRPDDQLILGIETQFGSNIMPIDYFGHLEQPSEYYEVGHACQKYTCISADSLQSNKDGVYELGFCKNCHRIALEQWKELIEKNSDALNEGFTL